MAPYNPLQSISMWRINSESLRSNNPDKVQDQKRRDAQRSMSDRITTGITNTGSIKSPVSSPVRSNVQDVMTPATIRDPRSPRPSNMPLIAGNVWVQPQKSNLITKDKLRTVLEQVDPSRRHIVLRGIVAKWWVIEWYNDPQSQITQSPQRAEPQFPLGTAPKQQWLKWSLVSWEEQYSVNPSFKFDSVKDQWPNALKLIWNVPSSAANVWANLLQLANPSNRWNIIKGAGSVIAWAAVNIAKWAWKLVNSMSEEEYNREIWRVVGSKSSFLQKINNSEAVADQMGEVLAKRAGFSNWEFDSQLLAKTITEDPVWVISDIAFILEWGWLAWAKALWWLASKWSNLAKAWDRLWDLWKLAWSIDPYSIIPKVAVWAAKAASKWALKVWSAIWEAGVWLLGKATGTSADTIKEVYRTAWSKWTVDALRWRTNDTSILEAVKSWVEDLREQRSILYWKDFDILKNNTSKINISPVKKAIVTELTDWLNVKIVDWELDFSKSKITSTASQKEIVNMYDDITKRDDLSPQWLDILKQRVSDYWRGTAEASKADRVSTMLSKQIKSLIINKVPEYARMTAKYEEMSILIRDIQWALGLWNKKATTTAITKLKWALRQNQEFRQAMIREIEKYGWDNIMWQIAWSQMNELLPRWLAWVWAWILWIGIWSLINPQFLFWLAASSPRIIGEIANALGVATKELQSYMDNVKWFYKRPKVVNSVPSWVRQALPEDTKTNIGSIKSPIVTPQTRSVNNIIERWTAKKPWTSRTNPIDNINKKEKALKSLKSEAKSTVRDVIKSKGTIVPKSPEITKLSTEAKKYKTADEFVNSLENNWDIIYHGTNKKFDTLDVWKSKIWDAIFFSTKRWFAGKYAWDKWRVIKWYLDKNSKVIDFTNKWEMDKFKNEISKNYPWLVYVIENKLQPALDSWNRWFIELEVFWIKKELKKLWYDWYIVRESWLPWFEENTKNIALFNTDVIKTEAQLRKIREEANNK